MAEFASAELEAGWGFVEQRIDALVALLDGRSAEELNWRPAAPEANSIFVLATHTIANARQGLLVVLCGGPDDRDRDAEFRAAGDTIEPIERRWHELRAEIRACLAALPAQRLDEALTHPRQGEMTGRQVLLLVATHAAEHLGQAELTRDLLAASGGTGAP
ncbi:MAG: DinB family protein [Chloroflexi bacterium]|nr:DinB family protein [Chloroflexota bacterium]